jgi:hypothetical protein
MCLSRTDHRCQSRHGLVESVDGHAERLQQLHIADLAR